MKKYTASIFFNLMVVGVLFVISRPVIYVVCNAIEGSDVYIGQLSNPFRHWVWLFWSTPNYVHFEDNGWAALLLIGCSFVSFFLHIILLIYICDYMLWLRHISKGGDYTPYREWNKKSDEDED